MTFERILWGSEIFTIAPLVGAVGFYYWARRSRRRAWLWASPAWSSRLLPLAW
jgi:hypothetical protein